VEDDSAENGTLHINFMWKPARGDPMNHTGDRYGFRRRDWPWIQPSALDGEYGLLHLLGCVKRL